MDDFNGRLQAATCEIGSSYFQLPVAGQQRPSYRERVYCYELYHQLRKRWPDDSQYSLGGEIDKSGHPLIRGGALNRAKPDFLVHKPGDISGNFAVIEVKPANASIAGVRKDLRTLTAFRKAAGYERGLLLVYGSLHPEALLDRLLALAGEQPGAIELPLLEVWHHAESEAPAVRLL